jgi:acetyl-CoA carboxylase carboxyltransferase component
MDLEFNKREDINRLKLSRISKIFTEIKKGGGEKRLQKQRENGKMTARERIDFLLDKNSESI